MACHYAQTATLETEPLGVSTQRRGEPKGRRARSFTPARLASERLMSSEMPSGEDRHQRAMRAHEESAIAHDDAATHWQAQGIEGKAQLERDLAEHERAGAALEERWIQQMAELERELTDYQRAGHALEERWRLLRDTDA